MRQSTVAGLSVLGMLLTSFVTAWLTGPKPTAAAATLDTPRKSAIEAPSVARVLLPGALELDARLGHEVVAAETPSETYLLFRAAARRPAEATGQRPLHVALLIDRSGSMRGRRLANALEAARGLVGRLRERDRLTVMAYDSKVESLLSSVVVGEESKRGIAQRLEIASARGSTCISCALEAGIDALAGDGRTVNHVLLLSDGEATAGIKSLEGLRDMARRAREKGIGVSSIGIDVDYNEALLSTLARFSNGRHHFVRDPGDLDLAFDRELGELAGTVATNATLEIKLASGVEVLEVFDREVERGPGLLRTRLGSFAAAEEKTLLVKVRVPAGGPRVANVAEFTYSYEGSTGPGAAVTAKSSLGVRASDQRSELSELDPAVLARIGRSRSGALLFEAGRLFKTGEPSDFAALDQKLGLELARIDRERKAVRPSAAASGGGARRDLDEQGKALKRAREILRTTRGARCACAPSDLACTMACAAAAPPKARKKRGWSCSPSDPLCVEGGGDLSSDEKAAAKESAGAAGPFAK